MRSQSEPMRSVRRRGVVPSVEWPKRSRRLFARIASSTAFAGSLPSALSATYLNLISFGSPTSPSVKPGDTTGSASSHIPQTGSLKAPSP